MRMISDRVECMRVWNDLVELVAEIDRIEVIALQIGKHDDLVILRPQQSATECSTLCSRRIRP